MFSFFQKKVRLIFLTGLLIVSCPQPDNTTPPVDESITIYSPEDMAKIGVMQTHPLSGTYLLMNNITLEDWPPIGDEAEPFAGVFNGNGKKITLNGFDGAAVSGKPWLGVFGYVQGGSASAKAVIKNLVIESSINATSTMATGQAVGLVAGYAEMAEIENVTLSGTFAFGSEKTIFAGGVAGLISGEGTLVKNSGSSLTMNIAPGSGDGLMAMTYNYVGGFVGMFRDGAGIENCHNTGNVTADNVANAVGGQVFVGGVAGGSYFVMNTTYKGYITDSSSTGTIIGRAQGFWTLVGGIAGAIEGGNVNNLATTTRVERCFVTGTISNQGDQSGFPYIGGVVAYNYYGALVSQSYFSGTIFSGGKTDPFACGGVVGYHSQITAPNNSRVEECYSSGTANINDGAIVVGTTAGSALTPERCYTITSPQPEAYYAGWNFTTVWKMGADGYPQLMWQ